jgi:hypothetical protein
MPKTFKSLDDFAKYFNNKIAPKAMKEASEKPKEMLKDNVNTDVYSYQPKEYERTYELRESIIATEPQNVNGKTVVEIKHDENKIHPYSPNQHMSVIYGTDFSPYLPEAINEGNIGHVFGQGVWTEPRPYMDNTVRQMEQENTFENEAKKSLQKQGIQIIDK